ncbi:MAG: glycosyltransferase, partial [Thermodesulfobacteriota bacterium]
SRFAGRRDFLYRLLILFEKLSCNVADVIISTNNSYRNIIVKRHNVDLKKCFIVRNDPIVSEFSVVNRSNCPKKEEEKKVLLFVGYINPQDGIDVLLQSLEHLVFVLNRKDFICRIIGAGDSLKSVKHMAKDLRLSDYIDFKGYISDRKKIHEYLALSDICLEPAPDNHLNRHSTFIKIMEYMAASKPIVAYDLEETRYSANGSAILVKLGDIKEFACGIRELMEDELARRELGRRGYERVKKDLNWDKTSSNLIQAYKLLSIN